MNILDKQLTLQLNRSWAAIGTRTIREAIVSLCSEHNGERPALSLDIEMRTDENGERIMVSCNPVDWETWCQLPVREDDLYINSSSGKIRAPLVIVACNYDRVPLRKPRLSVGNIWERDQGVCQYTGRKLSRSEANTDHVLPRSKGGRDEWTNLVTTSKKLNLMKGNRFNHEVGLKLIREPKAPKAIPASAFITEPKHDFWTPFLIKR